MENLQEFEQIMTSDLNFNSIEWTTRIKAGIAVKAGI